MIQSVYDTLRELEVVNGCGAKWSANFDNLIDDIWALPVFDERRWDNLSQRFRLEVCGPHDMDYHDGGYWIDKIMADILFVIRAYRLLDWTDWKIRYFLVIPGLVKLFREFQVEWKKTFNFREKSI